MLPHFRHSLPSCLTITLSMAKNCISVQKSCRIGIAVNQNWNAVVGNQNPADPDREPGRKSRSWRSRWFFLELAVFRETNRKSLPELRNPAANSRQKHSVCSFFGSVVGGFESRQSSLFTISDSITDIIIYIYIPLYPYVYYIIYIMILYPIDTID